MWKPATALRVPRHDRELLGFLSRAPKTPQRVAVRARIVLGAAAGRSINGLARELVEQRLAEWERFYNFGRPHGAFAGQTPYEALRERLQS